MRTYDPETLFEAFIAAAESGDYSDVAYYEFIDELELCSELSSKDKSRLRDLLEKVKVAKRAAPYAGEIVAIFNRAPSLHAHIANAVDSKKSA
jgi:hypothetical protein